MAKVIKWTNKYSNESGFLKSVKKADGHFVNTFDVAEAKTFARQCDIVRTMNVLESIGECENNDFEVVEL